MPKRYDSSLSPVFLVAFLCFLFPSTLAAQHAGGGGNGSSNGSGSGSESGYGFSPRSSEYLWPTNAGHYLSSTFAETRTGHFHSALDLKTWGRRGYDVYATRDGVVHRIAIGPTGYGKVIYLKHDDGSYSVYAHLLRFEDRLQQLADSLRMQNDYRFELDREIEDLGMEVRQGERIGISGASGIGPPHLHFELRNPNQEPFNPLLTNLRIKDTRPPQYSYLAVEPLSMTSTVEEENRIYTKRGWISRGEESFGTVDVSGPVGLAVTVFDQADDVHNAYAVYELKMYVDGELRFHSRADRFSYEETGQMFLDRIYPLLQSTGSAYQRLYVADGNTLPFYQSTPRNGKLHLSEGPHAVRIVASDYYGNTTVARLQLRVHPEKPFLYNETVSEAEQAEADDRDAAASYRLQPERWDWFDNWLNIPKAELGNLTLSPLRPGRSTYLGVEGSRFLRVDLRSARDLFIRASDRHHFIARRVQPDRYNIVPTTTDGSYAAFEAGTFYDTLSVGLTVETLKPDSVKVQVLPSTQPVARDFKLAVEADSLLRSRPHLAFYHYDPQKERFSYLETRTAAAHLVARPDRLGTYFLLSDTTPPTLGPAKIVKQPDNRWVAIVGVGDDLSGIDPARSEFYVNGVRGIAELEPEDDRLIYYHPDFTPKRDNTLRVVIYDREGNRTESEYHLQMGGSHLAK